MDTVIWAFGPMVILMMMIPFLRVGLTLKGKFIIVLTSFVLGLLGAFAASAYPLWLSLIMILLLTVITAFFIDSRFGVLFYIDHPSDEEIVEAIYDSTQNDHQVVEPDNDNVQVNINHDSLLSIHSHSEVETEKSTVRKGINNLANENNTVNKDVESKSWDLLELESMLLVETVERLEPLEELGDDRPSFIKNKPVSVQDVENKDLL